MHCNEKVVRGLYTYVSALSNIPAFLHLAIYVCTSLLFFQMLRRCDRVRLSCCSPNATASLQLHPVQLLVRPIVSTSAVARRLCPLRFTHRSHLLQLLPSDHILFTCCSQIVPTCSLNCSERFEPLNLQ